MSKHLFIIHDDGEYTKITGTTIRDDKFVVDPKLFYEIGEVDFFNTVSLLSLIHI